MRPDEGHMKAGSAGGRLAQDCQRLLAAKVVPPAFVFQKIQQLLPHLIPQDSFRCVSAFLRGEPRLPVEKYPSQL
jgi:hypothetical protein